MADAPDRSEEQAAKVAALRETMSEGHAFGNDAKTAAVHLTQGGEISRSEEMLEDEYLRRWLRARNWDVDVAARCIVSHAEWRVGMMPNGCIPAADIANELATEKTYLLGTDKDGRAVLLIQARKHGAWSRKLDELERYCCYLLDAAVAACDATRNPRRHIAVILDLTDMGMANMDVQAVQALFKLLGAHYVERLGQMVMYNPPSLFWGAWNTLSPLLPAVTLKKILVVAETDRQQLVGAVGPEVLPSEYGGTAAMPAPVK